MGTPRAYPNMLDTMVVVLVPVLPAVLFSVNTEVPIFVVEGELDISKDIPEGVDSFALDSSLVCPMHKKLHLFG